MLCALIGTLTHIQSAAAQSGDWQKLENYEGIRNDKKSNTKATNRAPQRPASTPVNDSGWIDLEEFTQSYEEQRINRSATPNQNKDDGWVPLEEFIPGGNASEGYGAEPDNPQSDEWTSLDEMFGASPPPLSPRITPLLSGDKILIKFHRVEDMSGIYNVSDIGTVEMPLIGNIHASGLTSLQLEDTLEQMYGRDYLNNPKISVDLQPRPLGDASLKGLINIPGDYAMTENLTLAEVLAKGAGATGLALGRDAVISRRRGKRVWVRRVALDNIRQGADDGPDILPGDLVTVVDRRAMPPLKDVDTQDYPLLSDVLRAGALIKY